MSPHGDGGHAAPTIVPQDALDAERRGHEAERAALQECIEEMRANMESLQTVPSYSEAHPNCKYLEFRELL